MVLAVRRFRSADAVEVKPDEPEWKKAVTKAFQKFVIGMYTLRMEISSVLLCLPAPNSIN